MVKASNLSFNYTGIPVFDQASFSIGSGQKVALVGPNGAGKSTLFGLIAGTLESEQGKVIVNGSVAWVPQEIKHDPVLDGALSIQAYIDPQHNYASHELKNVLRGLELEHLNLTDAPLSLSGGQKTRLALARALLLKPDVLLLDEPTNFLDEDGKQWVMKLLRTYPKTLLIVSHDIALLNTAIDKVLAINIHTKKIDEYSGTYDQFVRLKKQADERLRRSVLNERKHIASMKKGLRNMDRYTSEKGVRQRTRLKKRIRQLEANLPTLPRETASIRLKLPEPARVGEIPLMAQHITKRYGGKTVLDDVSLSLYRNERVAILGKNGAGKSTLIKILVGLLEPDMGSVLRDQSLSLGYYSQEFESFDLEQTLIESLYSETSGGDNVIRPLLARFLFTGQKVFNKIKTLSGGEKTRLAIARLLLKNYNLLVLDEPTTYLDPLSQRVILEALKQYTGGILVVSHTAQFLYELAPSRALLLPEQHISTWNASLLSHAEEV